MGITISLSSKNQENENVSIENGVYEISCIATNKKSRVLVLCRVRKHHSTLYALFWNSCGGKTLELSWTQALLTSLLTVKGNNIRNSSTPSWHMGPSTYQLTQSWIWDNVPDPYLPGFQYQKQFINIYSQFCSTHN